MADNFGKKPFGSENQGEGNKKADKQYRDGATEFARRTDTLQKGLDAERDVDMYRDEYEKAERDGKSHSAGELRADLGKDELNKK